MSVTWNTPFEASPAGSDSPALGDDKIREFKEAFRERFEHEHKMDLGVGTASLDGWHIQGSAISYIQADAPTTRPDGVTALSALDNGRLWVDTNDDSFYFYVHGTGWVALGIITAVGLNTTHRSSDGSDHANVVTLNGRVDQDVKETASPSFNGVTVPILHVRDQKSSGTGGGTSSTGMNIRTLNAEILNTISGASLASNQITLPEGTYKIRLKTIAYRSNPVRAYLYNVTDAVDSIVGFSNYTASGDSVTVNCTAESIITLAATKVLELRLSVGSGALSGLGVARNDGRIEVYSDVFIEKLG